MRYLLFLVGIPALAAPMLRLATSAVTWVPASPPTQAVCTTNAGDGALNVSAAVSGGSWLTVSIDARQCIQLTADLSKLSPGTYTASVTISDPRAIDAPQVITATAQAGGGDPVAIDQFVAPGAALSYPLVTGALGFCPPTCASVKATTQDGGTWLSVGFNAAATIQFNEVGYIHIFPPKAMSPGTYSGSVTLSNFAARTIPVTMRLTTDPIAVPSVPSIALRLAEGGPAMSSPFLPPITLTNRGMGALQVQGASASGVGVSASLSGSNVLVSVDPAARAPGVYTDGMVTIQCNGANCPIQVPVSIEVVPRASPTAAYGGVVDNATFASGAPVAPGDMCLVRGSQLSLLPPAFASGYPLPTSLGGATVLVNNVPAPLYYSSFGQVAFQVPFGTGSGTALVQVLRDGQQGNTITVPVIDRAPQILAITDSNYQIRDLDHPAQRGERLILWVIGLGVTTPVVDAGTPAPGDPPAVVANPPMVTFSGVLSKDAVPDFAGLSPGSAGLYQINVTVPADLTTGATTVRLASPNWTGNSLAIAVQ